MPRRLLFVDDEAMVLNGLRRALHGMRQEWNMEFVESAAAALQALDEKPYDAIISDMRMPVMDGASSLNRSNNVTPTSSASFSRDNQAGRRFSAPSRRLISSCQNPATLRSWWLDSARRSPCAATLAPNRLPLANGAAARLGAEKVRVW